MILNVYKFSAIVCCIYLLLSMNAFVLWLTWPPLLNFPTYILVLVCFLLLLSQHKINLKSHTFTLSLFVILFGLHICLPILTNITDLGRFYSLISFSLILFFPIKVYLYIYDYFIKFIKFICYSSVIVFFIGLFYELPHLKITNETAVLQHTGYYYKLYGYIVSSTNTQYNIGGLNISRICGIFPEPGHFATYLGGILLVEKLLFNKVSRIILVTGILTFSPVFYIILLLVIIYNFVINKSVKVIKNYVLSIIAVIILTSFLQDSFIDQIWELAIGRNLGDSIGERLNERTNMIALNSYNSFIKTSDVWVGKGVSYVEELGLFSDFRGFIFKHGIIGMILSLMISLSILFKSKSIKFLFLFSPFVLLIYIQRSWMFSSPYIYMLIYIFLIVYVNQQNDGNCDKKRIVI